MGRAKLVIDTHTGFDGGVAVPQHHMNITMTAWTGSRNSHPKDNVSGSPKKEAGKRERGSCWTDGNRHNQVFMLSLGTQWTEIYNLLVVVKAAPDLRISRRINKNFYFSAANAEPRQT